MLHLFVMLLLLAAFFFGHWAVYASLINFFGVKLVAAKNILIWGIFFLGVSFFISTILSHISDNFFTSGYYMLSGFWLGFLVNILLVFALLWIVRILGLWFSFTINNQLLAILVIVSATIFSIYGVYNAFAPVVKSIDVTIENLPSQWVGKKIVQISDVHLGHVYSAKYFSSIVEKINNLNPEVVVITGDLFDGTDGNLDSFTKPLNSFNSPVFFAQGNHEIYLGLDRVYQEIAKTKIVTLRDEVKTVNGLQFVGINYPLRGSDRDIAKIIPAMTDWNQSMPSVLLIHEPLQSESAKKLGINLRLSGHTHKGQLFPFGLITSAMFGKYDFGFQKDGSFSSYTSSGLGGWGPPMRTQKASEIVEITLH